MGTKKKSVGEEVLINNVERYYDALQTKGSQRKAELTSVRDELLQIPNNNLSYLSVADKHKYIGFTLRELGELEEALIFLNLSLKSGVSELDVYRTMARINFDQHDLDEALMNFNAEVRDHPRSSEAYNDRGVFYFNVGKFDNAFRDFNQAIKKNAWNIKNYGDKKNDAPLIHRAVMRILEGDYDSALEDVNMAIEANPDSIKYASLKSSLESVRENEDVAEKWLFNAAQLNAKSSIDLYFRAHARIQISEFEAAFDDVIIAQNNISEFSANLFMGDFYRLQGDKDSSELWYVSAIKSFIDKKTKYTSDYLTATKAADGLRKLNVPYEPMIPTKGVIGIKSLDETMVQNFLRLNL